MDKYNLGTHKNTCQRKQEGEREEEGGGGGGGVYWVQATNREVANCT